MNLQSLVINISPHQRNQFANKKTKARRIDMKTGPILLLNIGNTPQPERQILLLSKGLEKAFPIKWTKETSW